MPSKLDELKHYRAIDLFAGIGGIRLGFQQAFDDRIKFVFSNEIDKNCCKTYQANFGENPMGDITKVDPLSIPDFDILLGGFPCQAFSIAGRRKGFEDTRGTLFFYVADIIRVKKPIAFLLENVKNLVNHNHGKTFGVIKDVLTYDLGYHIHYRVLNAKDYELPQHRERIYIIGFRDNFKFDFPAPSSKKVTLNDILEPEVADNYYLSQQYLNGLKKHRARHEAKGHGFGYEVRERNGLANALVCGGMGKERNLVKDKILPNCWKNEGDNIQLRNNEGIRTMTEREWARLQGFPDDFVFPVGKMQTYKQLGNSVAVNVIRAIAQEMKKSLDDPIKIGDDLSDEEKKCIDLMETLHQKHMLSEGTGKKSIVTINNVVVQQGMSIGNLNRVLEQLQRVQMVQAINKKFVQFSKKILNIQNPDEFRLIIEQSLRRKASLGKLDALIKTKSPS